jgi:hypothetical protein
MKRKLILLNLVLLALAAGAVWRLRINWLAGRAEETRVLQPSIKPVPPPALESMRPGKPAVAAEYGEVANRMLFDPDRNPKVVVEVAPVKPMPPLPVAYGLMDMGSGPLAILSEKPGAANRSYAPGDKIGSFVLTSIDGEELVFEWSGQEVRRTFQDLKPQSSAPAPASSAAAPPGRAAAASVQSIGSAAPAEGAPGGQLTGDLKACQPTDTSPAGTVRDGYRKVINKTPFGMSCHWEPVK